MNLVVVAIFRDEAPYLAEWLAWHLAQGVEHFYLYENRSTDGWIDVLSRFRDVVTVVRWDVDQPSQLPSYGHYFRAVQIGLFPSAKWAAIIDCDEFLTVIRAKNELISPTIHEVLEGFDRSKVAAVAVNWMVYSGFNLEKRPKGLQIESFTRRCGGHARVNRHVKCIVDPARVIALGTPHHFGYRDGEAVDERGRPMPGPYTAAISHRRLRINHYLIRSQEEWREKVARGRADTGTKRDADEWKKYPAPVHDASAAEYGGHVRAILRARGFTEEEIK